MKFNKPLYYCSECKTILDSLKNLLFVEENSSKGFCSEACIEDFYMPLIRHFESIELNVRTKLGLVGLNEEKIDSILSERELLEDILLAPDELWKVENELSEDVYTYVKHYSAFSGIVICKVYAGEASFIFLSTKTTSRSFLEEICAGSRIENISKTHSLENIDSSNDFNDEDYNFMQLLESKKSKLLAELLEKRKEDDISFEDFSLYESCFTEVIETPDEVFEQKDNEGDSFFIYIKSYVVEEENYFYIISCLKRKVDSGSEDISVFPVLAFPTNDIELYYEFRTGKKIAGHLKN